MPSLKCSICGQRILNPAGLVACPNCGAPLAPQLAAPAVEFAEEGEAFSQLSVDSPPPFSNEHNQDTAPFPPVTPGMAASQFPKSFPKRSPDIEGIIIQVETHEEPKRSGGVAEGIFNMLTELIWAIPGSASSMQQSREKEKVQVTRARVRTQDGMQRDVRLEGRLTGVTLAQGDRVTLWGKESKGLLGFQYGYNHTTNGEIITSQKAAQRKAESSGVLLLIAALLIFLFMYFSHILSWPH